MAAGDRSNKIISRVRIRLNAIAVSVTEDEEILDFGNEVQTDLMVRLKCVENPITVTLTDTVDTYTLNNYQGRVKEIIPSWQGGGMNYIDNAKWNSYNEAVGSKPLYATIFGDTLYIVPAPAESGLSIVLWVHQKTYITAMSKTVDPETPEFIDQLLELGIMSMYSEKFELRYDKKIREYSPTVHQKQNLNLKADGDWMEPYKVRIEQFEE